MDDFINLMFQSIEQNAKQILLKIHAIYGYCDANEIYSNMHSQHIVGIASNVPTKTMGALEKVSVVKVPCFIGDIVYHIGRKDKKVHISTVKRIVISISGIKVILRCGKKGIIGKDIFLTEQEAKTKRII